MGLKQTLKKFVTRNALLNKFYHYYIQSKRKSLVKQNFKDRVLEKRENEFRNLGLSDIFRTTYMEKRWGSGKDEFYSGPGSYGAITTAYVDMLVDYIKSRKINSVVDLGCGDFNIGRQLTDKLPEIKYTGVDIFEEIIEHHKKRFANERINFLCINTTEQQVPGGDLLLIREVLQHLSNANINKIIKLQFPLFKHKIITEHHPDKSLFMTYNLDKPDGYGVRVDHGSGIYLDQAPFNLKWKEVLACKVDFGVVRSFEITG